MNPSFNTLLLAASLLNMALAGWVFVDNDENKVASNSIEMDYPKYDGYATIEVEVRGGVVWVTFDSQTSTVNAMDDAMLNDLKKLAGTLENDKNVKVVVFQSPPDKGIFIAHESVEILEQIQRKQKPPVTVQEVLQRISILPQATIAKVEGAARGAGHEFVLACDMRFAARGRATFMQMEVGLGAIPMAGGTQRLPHLVGLGRALEIMLGAEDFDADLAEKYGTINRALNSDEIGSFVGKLANRIAKFPLESITAVKKAATASIGSSIVDGLKVEASQLGEAMSTSRAAARINKMRESGIQYKPDLQKNWNEKILEY